MAVALEDSHEEGMESAQRGVSSGQRTSDSYATAVTQEPASLKLSRN